jgi:hypothetical protein
MSNTDVDRIRTLSQKLERIPRVQKLKLGDEPGGWRLAYAIVEIDESARRVTSNLIKRVQEAEKLEEIEQALHDLDDELKHLVYHLRDSGFFRASDSEKLISQ